MMCNQNDKHRQKDEERKMCLLSLLLPLIILEMFEEKKHQ